MSGRRPTTGDDSIFYRPDSEVTTRTMGLVIPPDMHQSSPSLTLTNEQINSVPLLLGVIGQMGIRDVIDAHVTPHGAWQGASVGTVVSLWLCHILAERDHRLVAVRDWVAERTQTFNTLLDLPLRDTDCTDDRLANVLTMLGEAPDPGAPGCGAAPAVGACLSPAHRDHALDSTSVSVYHEPSAPGESPAPGAQQRPSPRPAAVQSHAGDTRPAGLAADVPPCGGRNFTADDGLYVPRCMRRRPRRFGSCKVFVIGDSEIVSLGHPEPHGGGGQLLPGCLSTAIGHRGIGRLARASPEALGDLAVPEDKEPQDGRSPLGGAD